MRSASRPIRTCPNDPNGRTTARNDQCASRREGGLRPGECLSSSADLPLRYPRGCIGSQHLIQPAKVFVVPTRILTMCVNQHVNVGQDQAMAPSGRARQRRRQGPYGIENTLWIIRR
jgi:hypothetical protein